MKTTLKRLLSLLLALTMVVSMVPASAFAAETEETEPAVVTEPVETTAAAETEAPTTIPAETEPAPTTEPEEILFEEVPPVTEGMTYRVVDGIEREILLPRVDTPLDQLPNDDARFIEISDAFMNDGVVCVRNYIGKTDPSGNYVEEVPGDYKGFDGQWLACVMEFEGIAENGVLTIFDENTTAIINGTRCPTELLDEGTRIRVTYVYQLQTIQVFNVSLDIPAPVAGEKAVFEAEYTYPTGDRYEIGAGEGISATNGIRWIVGDSQKALKPGDKFESGHYYKALIYIKAGIGCRFAANVDATVSGAVDVYVSKYYSTETYEQYDPDVYRVVVAEFNLEGEYDIYVENGFAYSQDGDLIGSAKPGDIVTLKPGEPTEENFSFDAWEVVTPDNSIFTQENGDQIAETTIVMPAQDIHVQCCFWYTDVEEVNITLGGYSIGNHVESLSVSEDAPGVELGYNGRYGTNYAIYDGLKGTPNSLLPIGTVIEAGETYWLKVTLYPVPGYSLDGIYFAYYYDNAEYIKLDGVAAKEIYLNDDGSLDVAFLLPAAKTAAQHTITVIDGYAEVGTGTATSAIAGSKVYLYGIVPDGKGENHGFSHWEVVEGNLVLDSDEPYTSFTMPDEDVVVKAVYLPYVFDVYLTITEPAGGRKPDFAPKSLTEGITIGEVRWSKSAATHEVPMGKDDTFGYNTGYRVEIDVYLDDAHVFCEAPYGYINEEFADVYPDGKCLTLGYYFEVPAQQYTITVDGGRALAADGSEISAAAEGDRVFIEAVAPEGYLFDHWEVVKGDVQILWPEAHTNDFFMPAEDVEVKAVFTSMKDIPIMIVDGNGGDLNESYDISRRNRVDMLVCKGKATYPEDITWSTSSAAIATVEQPEGKSYWDLVFHKPGTVTITAKDAYGCKDTIKITGYYVANGKLTAKCEVPEIGLEVGQSTIMQVFGQYPTDAKPIDSGKLLYTVSKPGIVTINSLTGKITGIAPGTVTVNAAIVGDQTAGRKASVKITVIASQVGGIELHHLLENTDAIEEQETVQEGNSIYTIVYLDSDDFIDSVGTIRLTPKARSTQGQEIPLRKSLFKWTSSNTKVAKLKVNADGTATVTIPKKASGVARITVTSTDKGKHSQIFVLHVRDYAPKLATVKYTLDWWKEDSFVPLDLAESYGNTIRSVGIYEFNKGTKDYTDVSPNFAVRTEDDGTYSIGLKAEPAKSKGSIKACLKVTCKNGKSYSYLISVNIQNKQPKVTLVQFQKMDTFFRTSQVTLGQNISLGESTPIIESLKIVNDNKTITTVSGTTKLVFTKDFQNGKIAKVDPNVVFEVKCTGYKPFQMKFTVGVVTSQVKMTTDPAELTVTYANPGKSIQFRVVDAATGENLTGYISGADSISPVGGASVKYSTNGTADKSDDYLTCAFSAATADVTSIYSWNLPVQKSDWRQHVWMGVKIKYIPKVPTISLDKKVLNLNSTFTEREDRAIVTLSDTGMDLRNLDFEMSCVDNGGSDAFFLGQMLSVVCKDGVITAKFKDPDSIPKEGKCTFSAIPVIAGIRLPKVTVTVNVKADNSKAVITNSKASLNRYLAGREVFTTDCVVSGNLQLLGFKESGNEFVDIRYSGGKLQVKLKRSDAAAKYTFELTPKVKDPATGQIVYFSKKVKLTVSTYSSNQVGIQMSYSGKLDTFNPDSAMNVFVSKVKNAAAGGQKLVRMTGADAGLFTYSEDSNGQITLKLKKGYTYAGKKRYEVAFVYDVFGETVTTNPVKIKVSQGYYLPTVTPDTSIFFLSSRSARSKVMSFTVRLTGNDGAKLDANSIQLNSTKTPALLMRAMGAKPEVRVSADGKSARVIITFEHSNYLDIGKSYKLVLDVKPVGHLSDETPRTVTTTINVR